MINENSRFLKELYQLFHIEIDGRTSGCLFGSAVTGDWIESRSDLDLFIFIPEEKIDVFDQKIKIWKSTKDKPTLDGFVVYRSANTLMVREFHNFEKAFRLTENFIPLIDLWNIKNGSVHLFGEDVKVFVRDIDQQELRQWALKYIKDFWIPMIESGIFHGNESLKTRIPLSTLIWTASAVARILLLAKGKVCNSKLEALEWMENEHSVIRDSMRMLRVDFGKSDSSGLTFTGKQATDLGRVYLKLLSDVCN